MSILRNLRLHPLFAAENPRVLIADGLVVDDETLHILQSALTVPASVRLSTQGRHTHMKVKRSGIQGTASTICLEWQDIQN